MTGADSPVMALSSTDATPSMMSPSAGITSPAATRTMSPLRSDGRRHDFVGPVRALALGDRLGLGPRSVSACALPRPSAIASAKLAKSTVSQSQNVICSSKPRSPPPVDDVAGCRRSVVSTLPISTTNITGLRAIVRGCSLRNESPIARRTICGSQIDLCCAWPSEHLPRVHHEVLDDRAEAERGKERQRADDHDHADEQRR